MRESLPRPRGVHLVGSVPAPTVEVALRAASDVLGDRLRRLPDGEIGERSGWLDWQRQVFVHHPLLEMAPPLIGDYPPLPRARLRPGVTTRDVAFDHLGYADFAQASFAIFADLKRQGIVPAHCRFQVSLPTPLASVVAFVARDAQRALESACERAMLVELDQILAAIPGDQLAIQWDLAAEMWLWEGWVPPPFSAMKDGIVERLARLSQRIPRRVEMGYHLCHGDYQHRHFRDPDDATGAVAIVNRLCAAVERPINWVHIPVPPARADYDAYFEPLRNLRLRPRTELYLGVIDGDGAEGARRRIASAQRVVPEFGIAAACGLGRRAPQALADLLHLHAELSDPLVTEAPPMQPARSS